MIADNRLQVPEAVCAAEYSVLGSMLRDNACIPDVLPLVRLDDFTTNAGRLIFSAIVALWDTGKPADIVTVGERLEREGHFEEIGRGVLLGELWDCAPTAANAVYYSRIVRDRSILRQLSCAAANMQHAAEHPPGSAEEVLEEAERAIYSISELGAEGQTLPLRDLVFAALNQFDSAARHRGAVTGLPTGFRDLDSLTAGLQPSELVILAARPSVGKTALGLAIARNVMRDGGCVFFASLEQSSLELASRLLCSEARVNNHRLRSGHLSQEDSQRLADVVESVRGWKMHVDDAPRQSLLRINANARRLKRKYGIDLVVIDYLQLIDPENSRDSRHEQVGKISRRLKGMARELGIPVLAMAQLNRASEDRAAGRPRLSDLRESGSIEADADTVMLLHSQDSQPGQVEVIVAKQRNGPKGEILLAWRKEFTRFEDHAAGVPWEVS